MPAVILSDRSGFLPIIQKVLVDTRDLNMRIVLSIARNLANHLLKQRLFIRHQCNPQKSAIPRLQIADFGARGIEAPLWMRSFKLFTGPFGGGPSRNARRGLAGWRRRITRST